MTWFFTSIQSSDNSFIVLPQYVDQLKPLSIMISSKLLAFILLVIGIVQAIPLNERNEASSAGLEAQSNKDKVRFSFLFLFCHCWRLLCMHGQLTDHLNPRLLFAKPMATRNPSQRIMPKSCTKRLPRARM